MTSENQHVDGYHAGDALHLYITVVEDDGTAMDLTGASASWVLYNRNEVVVRKSTPDGISITTPTSGELRVEIDPADTEGLRGVYEHAAKVTDSGGNPSTVTTGKFTIKESYI